MFRNPEETIFILTYGGRPNPEAREGFQLTADSSRMARAGVELAKAESFTGKKVNIHVPGATFYGNHSDSQRIVEHVKSELIRQKMGQTVELITYSSDNLNTATQMAEIRKIQDVRHITPQEVKVICSDWQRGDAQALMTGYGINGGLLTDRDVYEVAFPSNKDFFDQLEASKIDQAKRSGMQAKIFAQINKIDPKGKIRTLASKFFKTLGLGLGIADIDFRGLEKGTKKETLAKYNSSQSGRNWRAIAEFRKSHQLSY